MTQTLAAGKTVTQSLKEKYVPLGTRETKHKTAEELYILLYGEAGQGKSYFMQSCPDAFILNLDDSPTTNPSAKAEMWPATGIANWKEMFETVEKLCDMKRRGVEGCPKMVVFDSLSAMLSLAIAYTAWSVRMNDNEIPKDRKPILGQMDPFDIYSVHGQILYSRSYALVAHVVNLCRAAGLGCTVVVHVAWETISLNQNKKDVTIERLKPTITANFLEYLFPTADAALWLRRVTKSVSLSREVTVGNKTIKKPYTESRTVQVLSQKHPDLDRHLKIRTDGPFPDEIEVATQNGWEAFSSAYTESQKN